MGRAPSSASFLSISHTSCLRLSVSVSKKLCTAGAPVTTFSVAACTLARSPIVAANRRLQPFRYLHDCSDCFRLERIAGWGLHPLESAALSRRTPIAAISRRHIRTTENLSAMNDRKLNRGLHATSWIRRPSDKDGLRTRTGKRNPRLHERGFELFERRSAHVELAAGGGHELAAEYFDARVDTVELSLQRLANQLAELRIERHVLADALDHLANFFAVDR